MIDKYLVVLCLRWIGKLWRVGFLINVETSNEQELLSYVVDFYSDKLIPRRDGGTDQDKSPTHSQQLSLIKKEGEGEKIVSPRKEYYELLSIICICHKGLTEQEMAKVLKISHGDMLRVLYLYKNFLMCYKGYWTCNNEIFREIIHNIYYHKPEIKTELHKRIAEVLEKSPSCVRKLEEQTYHYYQAGDDFSLKQIIATVENFLMLFNPMTKFDLFRYWQILEKSGYDPVTEYNKGIELFDSHFNPEPDKLFLIILQVCRFLKEFSDFETDITPVFRHPLIKDKIGVAKTKIDDKEEEGTAKTKDSTNKKGGVVLPPMGNKFAVEEHSPMKKIKMKETQKKMAHDSSIKKDLSNLHSEAIKKRKKEDPLGLELPFYNEDNELSEVDEAAPQQKEVARRNFNTFNYLDVIGLLKELKIFKLTRDTGNAKELSTAANTGRDNSTLRYEEKNAFKRRYDEILEDWEDVNIEVPEGRDRFRKKFVQILIDRDAHKERMKERDEDEIVTNSHPKLSDSEDEEYAAAKKHSALAIEEAEEQHEYQTRMNDIDLEIKPQKPPSFYYYKRWIWIIFPWATMSIKKDLNYSDVIARCYSSATKYMRIDEEKEIYKAALEIVIEYKMKKAAIYAKQQEEEPQGQIEQGQVKGLNLSKAHMYKAKELKEDETRTFSNRVVKKDDPILQKSIHSSRVMLPTLGRSTTGRSQASLKESLSKMNPKDTIFLTGVDGSVISAENISTPIITKNTKRSTQRSSKALISTRESERREFSSPKLIES
jgi:hypothetical protein